MLTSSVLWMRLRSKKVGHDAYGHTYYVYGAGKSVSKQRRWVWYKGMAEASKIPPEWHSWLHGLSDAPLKVKAHPWQRPHKPNLSGTVHAYVYPHDIHHITPTHLHPYEPWTPPLSGGKA